MNEESFGNYKIIFLFLWSNEQQLNSITQLMKPQTLQENTDKQISRPTTAIVK